MAKVATLPGWCAGLAAIRRVGKPRSRRHSQPLWQLRQPARLERATLGRPRSWRRRSTATTILRTGS